MAHEKDRRASVRSGTARQAMFLAVDGSTLLQAGAVLDLSRDGLSLVTRQPPTAGTIVEIEITAREDAQQSQPIITRGRVVRVDEIGDGEYIVGVKLRFRPQ
ncbi:MAG: PilZ domain-containing protein, partial [Candidatus Hydrogenedentes bacterium]|nr:PilZ domain-containing protein [Candidatus Hydrogenedentota bacterium]